MRKPFPSADIVWRAIDVYMKHAYDGPPPFLVTERIDTLRQEQVETFYECTSMEHDLHRPPMRYSLRLGNRNYPNMKLSIESTIDEATYFLKADTHDRHINVSPKSPDYQTYLKMTEANEELSKKIEAEWAKMGLPTFREYLRQDLARRQAAAARPT